MLIDDTWSNVIKFRFCYSPLIASLKCSPSPLRSSGDAEDVERASLANNNKCQRSVVCLVNDPFWTASSWLHIQCFIAPPKWYTESRMWWKAIPFRCNTFGSKRIIRSRRNEKKTKTGQSQEVQNLKQNHNKDCVNHSQTAELARSQNC